MSLLRLLNWQGIAGIAASLGLGLLLIIQMSETRHWKKQSSQFEQLYANEQAALAGTVANYRAAAADARAADLANFERVSAEQRTINERTEHDFEARLAAARTLAQRLRGQAGAAADSRPGGATSVPRVSASSGRASEAAGEDRLPHSDALVATQQAIQLDELIGWIREQSAIDPNATN